MFLKILSSVKQNCEGGWRFSEESCLFNAKIFLSLALCINILSIFIWTLGKNSAISFLRLAADDNMLIKIAYPLFMFILLTIFYPLKKIKSISLTPRQIRKYQIVYYGYLAFSIILFLVNLLTK